MKSFPVTAVTLGIITTIVSMGVAYVATGSILGKVTMIQLKSYGGLNVSSLVNWELWRLFTSQVVHAKQLHMFYNVLSLLALGYAIEKRVGWFRFLLVWFVAGAAGTLYSTLFTQAPWNTGTGGSQAILGLAGLGVVVTVTSRENRSLYFALMFQLIPAFSLDIIFANYPKPGHVLSLTVGMLIGVLYVKQITSETTQSMLRSSPVATRLTLKRALRAVKITRQQTFNNN